MKLRGADILARSLAGAGLTKVFALSGNHVMPVYDAAIEAKLDLVHVRHEGAAVHMADAWARLAGTTGIALVTGGPGHANALGALYTSLQGEVPLVLLSGHAPLSELGKGAFQEMAQAATAEPLVKASWTAQSTATLGEDIARAVRTAREGRPGPVHLSLPSDVLEASVEDGERAIAAAATFAPSIEALGAGDARALIERLSRAARPLVIAGPQLADRAGRAQLAKLEAATGVPAIVMESPRGVNDPSLGLLSEVLGKADVVFLLGKRVDFTLKFGTAFAAGAEILPLAPGLSARATLDALVAASTKAREGGWLAEAREALGWRPAAWKTLVSKTGGPVHPVELGRALQALLAKDPEAVFVSDGGEIGQWSQACVTAPHRAVNGVAGAIGPGLPFGIAAKLAKPKSTVVALMGDGTAGFHLAEFDTAVRCGANTIFVIGNDSVWNAEYQIQLRSYGAARAHGLEMRPGTRYDLVAQALGCHGEFVERADQLEGALARAAASGKPACVNVMIERLPAPSYKRG